MSKKWNDCHNFLIKHEFTEAFIAKLVNYYSLTNDYIGFKNYLNAVIELNENTKKRSYSQHVKNYINNF